MTSTRFEVRAIYMCSRRMAYCALQHVHWCYLALGRAETYELSDEPCTGVYTAHDGV